jgi:choline monooxygenase
MFVARRLVSCVTPLREAPRLSLRLHSSGGANTSVQNASALPASWYYDAEHFRRETEQYLNHEWQCVGHVSQFGARTGGASFIAESVGLNPIIVVRNGRSGVLSAFHNVCRHRGGPLEWTGERGSCDVNGLRCRYHGWVYSTDGALKGTPGFGDDAEAFDKKDYPLWRVRLANYRGFLFVKIGDKAANASLTAETAVETIGADSKSSGACDVADSFTRVHHDFIAHMKDLNLEAFSHFHERKHALKCNWKAYVENYAEGYHIPFMHNTLNASVNMHDYHVRCADTMAVHRVSAPQQGSADSLPANLVSGTWVYLAPTVMFNVYNGCLALERVVPTSPTSCDIRYLYLSASLPIDAMEPEALASDRSLGDDYDGYKPPADLCAKERRRRENVLRVSWQVTTEDVKICEAVQANLQSPGVYTPGRLSPRFENCVFWFQNKIRKAFP